MLNDSEERTWEDIRRYYDREAAEPVRRASVPAFAGEGVPGLDDLPALAVAAIWISILLIIFGAPVAGLAFGSATALGWWLWRLRGTPSS